MTTLQRKRTYDVRVLSKELPITEMELDAKEAIATIRSEVEKVGDDLISAKALLYFLDDLEKNTDVSVEGARRTHDFKLAYYVADCQSNVEMFKSVIESGKEALNALILISGGAVIGLLSFLGNKADPMLGRGLVTPLQLFGWAVLVGAGCHGLRYLSQVVYSKKWTKTGHGLTTVTVCSAMAGYGFFGWGVVGTAQSFSRYFQ